MTEEELEAAITKAREDIKNNTEGEGDRFRLFLDFQNKVASEVIEVVRNNTDLIEAGGYSLGGDDPRNAAGYWAVYCTAVSAALTVSAFLDSCVKIRFKRPGYENMKLSTTPEMITPNALANVAGHALLQVMNMQHNLQMQPVKAGEYAQRIAEAIEPMLLVLLESKEANKQ